MKKVELLMTIKILKIGFCSSLLLLLGKIFYSKLYLFVIDSVLKYSILE